MRALDDDNTRSIPGFGCEFLCRGPLHLDSRWGLTRESRESNNKFNLSLGQHTGDGKLDGETFLGRTWMFFFWGGWGRGIGIPGRRTAETFSQDDASSKQPCLCYILYIAQWKFRCNMSSGHREDSAPRMVDSAPRMVYLTSRRLLVFLYHSSTVSLRFPLCGMRTLPPMLMLLSSPHSLGSPNRYSATGSPSRISNSCSRTRAELNS